jgi:hypothetical protein
VTGWGRVGVDDGCVLVVVAEESVLAFSFLGLTSVIVGGIDSSDCG